MTEDTLFLNGWLLAGAFIALVLAACLRRWCITTLLTLRSLALTPLLSRRLARWVKARDYDSERFFAADGAAEPWVTRRRDALRRLAATFKTRYAESAAWGDAVRDGFSDIRFTDANRVPFPFARLMRTTFNLSAVVTESCGPRLRDLDGNWSLDVSGSYGLNVAGFDRYKAWIEQGWERVKGLGPVLGPVHPIVAGNIALLKTVSGLDEVSFHMSGTEAVMAAVRLARFNTGRRLIVCFAGAYHGWWDGVMPGVGSDRPLDDCLTLKDLDRRSLAVLRRRARDIAGVLVNPVQSFHPNSPPPNDAVLLTSSVRRTRESSDAYAAWLRELREVCHDCDIPLIFLGYLILPIVHLARAGGGTLDAFTAALPAIAELWWTWTWIVVLGRVAYLVWKHGLRASMVWYVKLVSDPLTDIVTYFPRRPQHA